MLDQQMLSSCAGMKRRTQGQSSLYNLELSSAMLLNPLIADYFKEIEVWLDVQGRFVWLNHVAVELWGYTAEELLSFPNVLEVLVAPVDRTRMQAAIELSLKGRAGSEREVCYLPRHGAERWMHVSWVPVFNSSHCLEGVQFRGVDITALRGASDEVKVLVSQQRAMLDGLPHAALLVGTDYRTLVGNQVALAAGSRSGAFFWENLRIEGDVQSDSALCQLVALSKECLATGRACSCRDVCFRNGVYDLFWAPFCSDAFFLYAEDVTIERQAVVALGKAEDQSQRITEVLQQGILQVDPFGRVVFANPAALLMSGYSKLDMRRATLQTLFAGGSSLLQRRGQGPDSGKPVVVEDTLISKNGCSVPVLISYAPLLDEAGGDQGFICSIVDISQSKKSREELLRLSAAVNQTDEAIVITEESGRILFVNPAFERLSGYPKREVIGKTPRILKSGKQAHCFYEQLWATILSGKTWTGTLVNRRKDTSLYTESCVISPVRDPDSGRTYFVAFNHDISEDLKHKEQRRQMHKMTALGRLASGVAHDFNNVLQGILGICDVVLTGDGDPQEILSWVRDIRNEALRGGTLSKQLLAFSRKDKQEFSAVNMNQLVAGQRSMLQRLIGTQVDFQFCEVADLAEVSAVPSQLEQVLMNLCVNARDAMPEGGSLSLALSEVQLDRLDLSASSSARAGHYVCLSVSDTGTGMSDEVREHLFEPFYTTKPKEKGTGLGLALVFGIVKQHDGWIEVNSELGRGSEFKLFLPVASSQDEAAGQAPAGAPAAVGKLDGNGESVLVIEDDPMIRRLLIRFLEQNGFKVSCAENSAEAREFFDREKGQFSLLFSDIVLPGRNGFEMAKEFVAEEPALPVVLCSGYYDAVVSKAEIDAAGFHLLPKPFSLQQMLEVVAKAMHKELTH